MKTRFLIAFLVALSAPYELAAQTARAPVRLLPESRMWIDGDSNVNAFTCRTRALHRNVAFTDSEVREIAGLPASLARTLKIPVRSFRCGNERMERDMYRALKADAAPFIHFTLYSYVVSRGGDSSDGSPQDLSEGPLHASAVGRMRIAGIDRVIDLDAVIERAGPGRFRVRGTKPIRMSDFEIEPPSALLGLVKARDRVVIGFDLLVEPVHGLSLARERDLLR